MTSAPQTYATETPKLDYEDGYLTGVQMTDAIYRVYDNTYEHTWFTNGKVKRMVSRFNQPIALRCYSSLSRGYESHYKVEVVNRDGGKPVLKETFQSINSLICYYSIRQDLISDLLSKMAS